MTPVTIAIENAILAIPPGKVSTYGLVARAAGQPNGARQVARVLHSRSRIAGLPWHRVLGKGDRPGTARISLTGSGFDEQAALLRSEGVAVTAEGSVDFVEFGCTPCCNTEMKNIHGQPAAGRVVGSIHGGAL